MGGLPQSSSYYTTQLRLIRYFAHQRSVTLISIFQLQLQIIKSRQREPEQFGFGSWFSFHLFCEQTDLSLQPSGCFRVAFSALLCQREHPVPRILTSVKL